jgi:hypothetical protein
VINLNTLVSINERGESWRALKHQDASLLAQLRELQLSKMFIPLRTEASLGQSASLPETETDNNPRPDPPNQQPSSLGTLSEYLAAMQSELNQLIAQATTKTENTDH